MPLFGLSMSERERKIGQAPFLDRLHGREPSASGSPFDLLGYIDAALTGSLPQSIAAPSVQARRRFLLSYLDDAVERDAASIEPNRDPNGLRRFLQTWAGLSGAAVPDQTVFQLADVNRVTGLAYESLLADDVIVEFDDGRVVALEIKATSAPKRADAKHLYWLKEKLGDRLVVAAVLHTGPMRFELGDGVDAIPISEIWA